MKRPREDSSCGDSELDDREKLSSECGSLTSTTQVMARKKRRGIIEKRRRDRINNSLSELHRLVPAAAEKQGSAKLEKAEILQMTVDHLKMLQITGGQGYLDSQILDFLCLGFRECVMEVSHYLIAVEGMDPSDPLSSRLLCHLTSCASQCDSALKAAAHQQPHLRHPWVAGPRLLSHRPSGLMVPSDVGGAPQRLGEVLSPSPFMLSCPSFSTPLLSFPVALHQGFPLLPRPSSLSPHSKQYRPWASEVGAF
ncbi:hairy/enhancer-of-split related with YRPW motif protein 2 [Austrofundulus limnaeus]|uniref:Hairy/enhancer-of-split related with YRPW motif protein 2 n=1 Tax=Austrofundulus limnaeus TaxID=52670 RepID=A0A2I4C0A7_AUSLI|nr:PREDICTED: hairy/enhancer-of-split related with YRPW motif protein 2-like [Austrofundulus limnaeus]